MNDKSSTSIGAVLSVYWPDDNKYAVLKPEDWKEVRSGKKISCDGVGYMYEGDRFQDVWIFNGDEPGGVIVEYDDGGQGYIGHLQDGEIGIEEFNYTEKEYRRLVRFYTS